MPAFRRLATLTATAAVGSTLLLCAAGTGPASAASVATWDKVAQCESSGNWSINTGNGYYGGLQFSLSTWRAYGGTQYAAYPHQASKKEQILTAERVLAGQGPGAWPHCGQVAGLGRDHADPYPDAPTVPTPAPSWKTQVLVEAGQGLFHASRFDNGTWTRFGDVSAAAGSVPGGVRDLAEAGINGDTHVLAVNGTGRLLHSIRFDDRSWTDFGDVGAVAGALANVTQVSAASIGTELHVAVVADGTVHHTIRHADGTWDAFGSLGRPGGAPVAKVEIARTGDQLQVVALSDTGVLRHAIRHADRTWTAWGDASAAAGATAAGIARIDDVAVAGTGNGDLQLVVTANGGAQQFHGARYGSGTWTGFNSLAGIVPSTTVTDVAAAAIEGELQVAMVTADGRVLHTIRHTNATWSPAGTVDLTGVPGTRTGIAVTGTYS
ncbi:transglycosylase family protein [Streptomyces antimicrobicus]|uniref:transglycosylase family protein n=1 Tax=Streptomyces antimicrobicus TaxID=2883108 RepID=UPI0027DFE5DD|nr:transglycosylase family protein [Streptomyces antimicrobicus]